MNKYVIFYTLRAKQDYRPLHEALRFLGAVHADGSIWFLSTAMDTVTVRSKLLQHLMMDDTLCVLQLTVGAQWAAFALNAEAIKWLQNNIHS